MQIPNRDDPPSDDAEEQSQSENLDTSRPINQLSTEVVVTTPAYIAFKDVKTATGLFGKVEGLRGKLQHPGCEAPRKQCPS